jgi:hypothetical protein
LSKPALHTNRIAHDTALGAAGESIAPALKVPAPESDTDTGPANCRRHRPLILHLKLNFEISIPDEPTVLAFERPNA